MISKKELPLVPFPDKGARYSSGILPPPPTIVYPLLSNSDDISCIWRLVAAEPNRPPTFSVVVVASTTFHVLLSRFVVLTTFVPFVTAFTAVPPTKTCATSPTAFPIMLALTSPFPEENSLYVCCNDVLTAS